MCCHLLAVSGAVQLFSNNSEVPDSSTVPLDTVGETAVMSAVESYNLGPMSATGTHQWDSDHCVMKMMMMMMVTIIMAIVCSACSTGWSVTVHNEIRSCESCRLFVKLFSQRIGQWQGFCLQGSTIQKYQRHTEV